MAIPDIVGFRLTGRLPAGATATDLLFTVAQLLRDQDAIVLREQLCPFLRLREHAQLIPNCIDVRAIHLAPHFRIVEVGGLYGVISEPQRRHM